MAFLKDTVVAGDLRVTDTIYGIVHMTTITGTIPTSTSSPWIINTTNKTVQISNANITANSILYWNLASTATQAQYEAFAEAEFVDNATTTGSATIKALGTMPTVAIPVVIHIIGKTA